MLACENNFEQNNENEHVNKNSSDGENEFDSYKDGGLSGLANLGNTCFINSCMQVISHTYELNDFLNKQKYKKKLNNKFDSALLLEWDNLRKLLWAENCIVKPGKFIQTVQKMAHIKGAELFTGYSQNDLPEFFMYNVCANG